MREFLEEYGSVLFVLIIFASVIPCVMGIFTDLGNKPVTVEDNGYA